MKLQEKYNILLKNPAIWCTLLLRSCSKIPLRKFSPIILEILLICFFLLINKNNGIINAATPPFKLPIEGSLTILNYFQPGAHRWNPGHRGVDLVAVSNTVIYAAGSGEIVFSGTINGINIVSILHKQGFITSYEPVLSNLSAGDYVRKGQLIGKISGSITHCSECLHWGARYFHGHTSIYFDPLALIGLAHIQLKPIN